MTRKEEIFKSLNIKNKVMKAYTDIEQSKKLAEIGKYEEIDLYGTENRVLRKQEFNKIL